MYDLTAKLVDGEEERLVIEKRRHREKEAESRERKDEKRRVAACSCRTPQALYRVSVLE